MNTTLSNARKQAILSYETTMAQRLAKDVLDKPKPPLWMIFVPIFFVFFAQKMREYSGNLEDFVENYLKVRIMALDEAMADSPEAEQRLLEKAGGVPQHAQPLFLAWVSILVDHYKALLAARGETHESLVRTAYRNKTEYLLFCNALNKAENAFNIALLPDIHEEAQAVRQVIDKMHASVTELRRHSADLIFP